MENKHLFIAKLKDKFRNTSKKAWIATGIIGGFVLLAIICLIVVIIIENGSLAVFFSKTWGWFLLGFFALVAIILTLLFWRAKKGK